MATEKNYEELFKQALYHLRCVSGSRNAFTKEVRERLWFGEHPIDTLRSPTVEEMHDEGVKFLAEHDKFLAE